MVMPGNYTVFVGRRMLHIGWDVTKTSIEPGADSAGVVSNSEALKSLKRFVK
jgi:hypothetical protein